MIKTLRNIKTYLISKIYSRKVTIISKPVKFYIGSNVSLYYGANRNSITIDAFSRIYGRITCCKNGKVKIGKYSQLGYLSKIQCSESITIGDAVAIGPNVTICDNNNHPVNPTDRKIQQMSPAGDIKRSWLFSDSKPIVIGNNVWIGENSRICKGVNIGDNSIIGACTVVTKDVPANCIVVGNPGRIVKTDINKMDQKFFL